MVTRKGWGIGERVEGTEKVGEGLRLVAGGASYSFVFKNSYYFIFFCPDLCTEEIGVLKSPTITEWESIWDFRINSISLIKLSAVVFGTYIFRIMVSCGGLLC